MPMYSIKTEVQPDCCVLLLSGEVDLSAAEDLVTSGTRMLTDSTAPKLVIDFHEVAFIDSTAIGALVQIRNSSLELGKQVSLRRLSDRVKKVLWISSLDTVFTIEDDDAPPSPRPGE